MRQAARARDLLILMGASGSLRRGHHRARHLDLAGGEVGLAARCRATGISPADEASSGGRRVPGTAGRFVSSRDPAHPDASPAPGDWVALSAQLGRRGAPRPAVFGRGTGRVRRVTVAVDGLWRWAFRGGSSEQSYRTWVAATASWLLGGADSAAASPGRCGAVVSNGRPVVFEWTGSGPAGARWPSPGRRGHRPRARHAPLRRQRPRGGVAPPGEYRYRLAGGGGGTVAVEEYSDELLPRPVTLRARGAGRPTPVGRAASARDWLWLFGLCVLALAGEWLARRRLGLR